jgi:ubiquinone/menaquinone biosynthesis C-methylase UbiE
MLEGRGPLRDAYRDETVAQTYIEQRFKEPLGAVLHARQAAALRQLIREARPRDVLEIAPGPARLTVEAAPLLPHGVTIVDTSAQMLRQARRRLALLPAPRCRVMQADAFALPFDATFDLAYSFRLIRHFGAADRQRLYAEIRRVLRPGGRLMFDAVNVSVSAPLRARALTGAYRHFDALTTEADLRHELATAGFDHVSLQGVQHRFPWMTKVQVLVAPRSARLARLGIELIDRVPAGAPLEWIVSCRRA